MTNNKTKQNLKELIKKDYEKTRMKMMLLTGR